MHQNQFFRKIKVSLKFYLKALFQNIGIGITSFDNLVELQKRSQDSSRLDLDFLRASNPIHYERLIASFSKSKSQLRQDLFVLTELNWKRGGFFVEFGATNGIDLSNTFLLESEYSWKGILAEPARVWQKELRKNRPNSTIENRCVWKDSNSILTFNETTIPELSTVQLLSDNDLHRDERLKGQKYLVSTISLNELLWEHQAPELIDYLSIDTEGSEFEILKAFDFKNYKIKIITVEHNHTCQRQLIHALLTSQGYIRKFEDISAFDDWYVLS